MGASNKNLVIALTTGVEEFRVLFVLQQQGLRGIVVWQNVGDGGYRPRCTRNHHAVR